ncbi:hypothetical protein [Reichenbachiella sp.]|uniref:hypothetical protein n=1 Tax=Reichenbachiella sp. TaxID=2184521 RepID=UPI003BB11C99
MKSDRLDNSSLADINGSYQSVQGSKILPIHFRMFLTNCILILLPFSFLLLTKYSPLELVRYLIEAMVN